MERGLDRVADRRAAANDSHLLTADARVNLDLRAAVRATPATERGPHTSRGVEPTRQSPSPRLYLRELTNAALHTAKRYFEFHRDLHL